MIYQPGRRATCYAQRMIVVQTVSVSISGYVDAIEAMRQLRAVLADVQFDFSVIVSEK